MRYEALRPFSRSELVALLASAVLFGIVVSFGDAWIPNIGYGLISIMCGMFYGNVYNRTRLITVSAFSNALVQYVVWQWLAAPNSGRPR
jgi:membrane protease YdiL (CAAX protease family)